ncbi:MULTISPECIES: Hint domain-containing protein [unclassified Yoonia]|uniref:Hint domain-containing protein n=1 Tax=unclassified Yoonia TaxID=2629118 RepID=UPI002AFE5AF3|nr:MULTISPECIES: Hint domain-containing protein [unclassified Yoonia]
MTYTTPILLTGDQVATISGQPTNQGNPGDPNFGMVMNNVTALGGPTDVYRLVWFQNRNTTDTFFRNGQGWRLEQYTGTGDPTTDTANWANIPGIGNLGPRNDLVSGVGGGDEYIVFSRGSNFLLYNINGGLPTTPTTLFYPGSAQNGDPNAGNNNSELDFTDAYAAFNVICFCAGTLIATDKGQVPIERLAVGDLVETLDSGLQPIRWIGRSDISLATTVLHRNILPVCIAAGAMGAGLPMRDLWLSPQHRVLVRSKIVARMAGSPEALVAVKQLSAIPGISPVMRPRDVSYLHLRLDRHEMVRAEGIWAETLLVGPQALRGMSPDARQELALIFPGLVEELCDAVRPVMAGHSARTLAQRHLQNHKALLSETH